MRQVVQIAVALAMAVISGCDNRDIYLGSDIHPQAPSGGTGGGGASGTSGRSGSGGRGGGMVTTSDAGTGTGRGSGGSMSTGSGGRMNTGSGGATVMPVQDSGTGGTGGTMMTDAGNPAGCPQGFADCDGRSDNGCETETDSDDTHCGDCDTACPPFGLMSFGSNCTAGVCVLICEGVFANCDGNPDNGCESVGPCP